MTDKINQQFPKDYYDILEKTKLAGFSMASDVLTCSLLRSLAASKQSGKFLELGTGTGLSTSWILDGIDKHSTLTSIDNDGTFLRIAKEALSWDKRLNVVQIDGADWISGNRNQKFDFIFADTWHGKFSLVDEVLDMIGKAGFYIVDDMLPQPNWPDGHHEKVEKLVAHLESREDLTLTKLTWSTGILIAVKK